MNQNKLNDPFQINFDDNNNNTIIKKKNKKCNKFCFCLCYLLIILFTNYISFCLGFIYDQRNDDGSLSNEYII